MQETRQHILEILNHRGQATVEEIVTELRDRRGSSITAVTVRHHLKQLQASELIDSPNLRHKSRPGRPQHVYTLTEKARDHFPDNYQNLASTLLASMREHLSDDGVNVIIEGVADRMAETAAIPDLPLPQRLNLVVKYLDEQGYDAGWEQSDDGYLLFTRNCPYHDVAQHDESLCRMDMRLIASLVGIVPRQKERVVNGDATCTYFFPHNADARQLN